MRKGAPIKSIDEQGRVLIPSHIRDRLNLRPGDPVEVTETKGGDAILVRRAVDRCIGCGTPLTSGKYAKINEENKLCIRCCETVVEAMTKE